MTEPLLNYQWELDGVVFGADCPVEHEANAAPSGYTRRTQDTPNPARDGKSLGIDLFDPTAWGFQLFTNGTDEGSALTALAELATAWRADDIRQVTKAVMPLRYRLNNRTRRVYGRPNRWEAPLGPEFHGGKIPITCDFNTVSELFFDDDEDSITVGSVEPKTGGLLAPLSAPLSTELSSATRDHTADVGGLLSTPFWVKFYGPSTDAYLEIDGVRVIQLRGSLPSGESEAVVVDARPWIMAVYRDSDGAGRSDLMHPRFRLPKLLLKPGSHQFTYGATDPTGSSYAKVSWRGAHPTV